MNTLTFKVHCVLGLYPIDWFAVEKIYLRHLASIWVWHISSDQHLAVGNDVQINARSTQLSP